MSNIIDFSTIPVAIMAGGRGVRMKPYSDTIPKPLLDYQGKSMLETVITQYIDVGFRQFHLFLCYKGGLVKAYVESLKLPAVFYYYQETIPLGSAGGLFCLKGRISTDFLVCNCDNLGVFNYQHGFETHINNNADITIYCKPQTFTIPFGIIKLEQQNGTVDKIEEKPNIDFYASTGIHILSPRVLDYLDGQIPMDMPELINTVAKKGLVVAEKVDTEKWIDMSIR